MYAAVEKGNVEIVKILLENEKIDVNILNIFFLNAFIEFKIQLIWYNFNIFVFESNLKLLISITFYIC